MDQESVKIYAVEVMEESAQVSADYDQFRFQAARRS